MLENESMSHAIIFKCFTSYPVPSRAPSNVKVKPGTEDNTLSVTWTSLMCESGEPYIHKYIIQYCQVDKLNHCVTGKIFFA